jgi:lysophospholipase L1-like esterase
MKSIRAYANRTGLLLSILLTAGIGWAQSASEPASQPASVLKPGDHILFIGDSITGLGDREITTQTRDTEFVPLIRQALAATHKDSKFELVTLGASGSTVGAWLNFFALAADPKQKEFTTDVPQFGVKATLAKNWDVVIIMLGMNDVLQPAVNDDKESLANWDASYARLIQTARDRLHPRVVALAQCTMASEDRDSAMNKFVDKLNEHVAATAKKTDCVFLPTDNEYKRMLHLGRFLRNDFHVMYDFIHPSMEGQIAIADGMLEGLGNHLAKGWIESKFVEPLFNRIKEKSPFSYWTSPLGGKDDQVSFKLTFVWRNAPVNAGNVIAYDYGAEWTILGKGIAEYFFEPKPSDCYSTVETLTGKPDRLQNVFQISPYRQEKSGMVFEKNSTGKQVNIPVNLPSPWLITAGPVYIWGDHKFDEKAARTAIDDAIEAGKDFTSGDIDVVMQASSVPTSPAAKTTGKLTWHRFFPSVDYTGGDAPGNVDFWSISYPHCFETGYAARWVWSEKDRPVRLVASSKGFTRGTYMQVWINGKKEYGGEVSEEKEMKKEFAGSLNKGWNCVAFRCCHRSYFFQSDLEMLPVEKDNLDDLRFSVVPKTDKSPAPQK